MSPHPWRGLLGALLLALSLPGAGAQSLPIGPSDAPAPIEEAVPPPPDLVPGNVHGDASDETRPVRLCTWVQNLGQVGGPNRDQYTPSGPFDVALHVDGFERGTFRATEPMAPGAGVDACVNTTLTQGVHRFHFVVDPGEEVAESREDNNVGREWSVRVAAPPAPDLWIRQFEISPRVAREDGVQLFFAEVLNEGDAPSAATVLDFVDETGLIARLPVQPLEPGAKAQVMTTTRPALRPYGDFVARAIVDPVGNVTEHIEENNEEQRLYSIPRHPLPDLRFGEVRLNASENETLVAGRTVRLEATVHNVGDRDAGAFTLRVVDNGTTIREIGRSSLPASGSTKAQILLTLPAGDHPLRLVLDPESRLAEHNESDNAHEILLVVQASAVDVTLPNLALVSVNAAPNDPAPGETITIVAFLRNDGGSRVNASTVEFSVNGRPVGRAPTPAMDVGHGATVTWSWRAEGPGSYTLRAIADATRSHEELEEGDNEAAQTFVVLDPEAEPPEADPEPPTPTPPTPLPTPPVVQPTPPADPSDGGGSNATSVVVSGVRVTTRAVPDGAKGIIVATLRNPSLDELGRMSVTFRVDGSPVKEVLVDGLRGAATAPVSTGEIDLPPGAHKVDVDVRFVGTGTTAASGSAQYDAAAGESDVPGPGLALVALAALGAALGRRKR